MEEEDFTSVPCSDVAHPAAGQVDGALHGGRKQLRARVLRRPFAVPARPLLAACATGGSRLGLTGSFHYNL